jgi:hypothetical protein
MDRPSISWILECRRCPQHQKKMRGRENSYSNVNVMYKNGVYKASINLCVDQNRRPRRNENKHLYRGVGKVFFEQVPGVGELKGDDGMRRFPGQREGGQRGHQ